MSQYREQSPNRQRNEALAQLLRAREATEKIDKASLYEIKSLKKPNNLIQLCMNPVNILFGREPNWKETTNMLIQQKTIKDDMRKYDIQQVTPDMLAKMQVYTSDKNYSPEIIKKGNYSCGTIATWVLAVEKTAILHHNLPEKSSYYDQGNALDHVPVKPVAGSTPYRKGRGVGVRDTDDEEEQQLEDQNQEHVQLQAQQAPRPNIETNGVSVNVSSPGTKNLASPGTKKARKINGISPSPKKNSSPRRQHKIDFVSLNKKDAVAYKQRPTTSKKPSNVSPSRLDTVMKTKVKPARDWKGNMNTQGRPDSVYHNVLYQKPQRTAVFVRDPSPVYSQHSTPEKHYIQEKEFSPVEMPNNYPEAETVQIDLNQDESYEIQQEIHVVEPVADVSNDIVVTPIESPPVEVQKPVVPTKVFTDEQLQKFMDKSVKKNVDGRMTDHKETVRRELQKYRQTNMNQIEYHFKNPQMVQVQYQPQPYYPPQGYAPAPQGYAPSSQAYASSPAAQYANTTNEDSYIVEQRDVVNDINVSDNGTIKQSYPPNILKRNQTQNYEKVQQQQEHEMMIGQY